jgi:hypothetical protein
MSWLEASTDKTCRVSTPFLQFPNDFELEVWFSRISHKRPSELFDPRANLKIKLEGDQGTIDLPIAMRFNDDWFLSPGVNPPILFMDKKGDWNGEYLSGQRNRFRLLREGNTYRCSIRDQTVVECNIPGKQQFRRVSFEFGGPDYGFSKAGARQLKVYGVSVRPHSKAEAKPPFTPFVEDFRAVKEGELPKDWLGHSALGVRRNQTTSWLEASAEGNFQGFTPSVQLPASFKLEVWASVPSAGYYGGTQLEIALQGSGNTPDLITGFKRPLAKSGLDVTFTNSASHSIEDAAGDTKGDSPMRIQLIRDGESYHLIVNDKKIVVQRMPKYQDFGRIAFILSGGTEKKARIFKVSVDKYPPDEETAGAPPASVTSTLILKSKVPVREGVNAWVEVDGKRAAEWKVSTRELKLSLPAGKHRVTVNSTFRGNRQPPVYDEFVNLTADETLTVQVD